MGTKEKRKREEESSSDEDEEAKKIREELRKRRRIEHERRKEERRRKAAEEREQLMLANMSATERRSYLAEKEEKQLREQRDALKRKVEESRKTRQVEQDEEERAYQVKRAQWELEHKTWTLDDESDDDDVAADAAAAGGGDGAEEDPFASFVTGLAATGAAAPAIIGVTDRRSNTVATLDEVKAAKWKAQKRQQQRAAAAAAAAAPGDGGNAFGEAMEEDSEDEKAASSFIAALKRFRPEDNPSPTPTPTPTPPPQETTAAVADVDMGGDEGAGAAAAAAAQDDGDAEASKPSKEEVHFDFDDEDFKERSYHVQKKEEHIKDLKKVDHSSIDYPPFRKNFYVAARAVKGLAPQAVAERRHALDKMRVRVVNGSDPNQIPAPIEKWEQCGLSDGLIDTLREQRFEVPFPIQAQGIPVIMSGLDMIGIARTGSGKTVAYVLPMIRHILDQPPLADSEGPIGWVLVPTRELAVQVHRTAALFCKKVKLRCCACYGGSPISDQIKELKRGVHIVIGTPGRLVDLMVANKGRVLGTYRATFCVLDEADRMFDDGFGPQVTKITDNMRPDRQMVMFSATFQKQIEAAAKRFLSPETVEVLVGGRCSASTNVTQFVECFEDADHKFKRLLQILGTWYAKGLILIFTETQQEVDELWEALFKAGYDENCVTLHGGMDQLDRDLALHEFKVGGKHILVATSVASRGIDVADLELVVNYRVPSHIEDYIHRIGRTGRAGKRGTAYTFYMIGQDEAHATSLVKVLQESNNQVPEDLQNISNACWEARNSGQITNWNPSNKGFRGGRGYRFDAKESRHRKEDIKQQMRARGIVMDESSDEDGDEHIDKVNIASGGRVANVTTVGGELVMHTGAKEQRAREYMDQLSLTIARTEQLASENKFTEELEINDYPQSARWKVTNKDQIDQVVTDNELEVTVMTKGVYCKSGRAPPGEQKLSIQIDGRSRADVQAAKRILKEVLEAEMQRQLSAGSSLGVGKAIKGR